MANPAGLGMMALGAGLAFIHAVLWTLAPYLARTRTRMFWYPMQDHWSDEERGHWVRGICKLAFVAASGFIVLGAAAYILGP